MYLGYHASLRWLSDVHRLVAKRESSLANARVQLFVVPSFPLLEQAVRTFADTSVWVGAQNCAWGDGALTGEVSAALLDEMGVRIVEIGHAERRSLFHEHDAIIAQKAAVARAAGLMPLLCVGEPERCSAEDAAQYCLEQVRAAVELASETTGNTPEPVLIAYEPVWAIGAADPAPVDYVNDVISLLRTALGVPVGIIYGGSAGPGLLPRLPAADGLFLGRFAHDPANLARVLDETIVGRPELQESA
jgi:triosephosphate isomerase